MTLTADDRLALLELDARDSHAVDANDGAAWAACFTEDGVFVPSTGHIAGGVYRGREQLAALGSDPGREPPTRHWTVNHLFTEHADHVDGTCHAMRVEIGGDEPVVAAPAVYHDEIVEEGGRWLFRSRRPTLDVQRYRAQAS